ncbi:MAG: hypothetical protein D6786_04165 [Gammaproteobacteria bacterium]|nr:MAG: hypothetical protein D6786_04165 [Gammaproteobacteria bacterium]
MIRPARACHALLIASLGAPALAGEPALPAGLDPFQESGGEAVAEPPLPGGLDGPAATETTGEPALPGGLSPGTAPTEGADEGPVLPAGLEGGEAIAPETEGEEAAGLPGGSVSGFLEQRAGHRVVGDATERGISLNETRFQLEWEAYLARATLRLTTDLLYDNVPQTQRLELNEGRGFLDLREASIALPLTGFMDLKAGRQILTWGVGDLLFINDLFPKDWNAFFIGRDVEYLKAPSDALKLSLYSRWANLDLVWTPQFDPDRFIDGRRLSYFAPTLGRIAGRDAVVRPLTPDTLLRDEEWALRLYRNFGPWEAALYAYSGFWKSPAGSDAATGLATFPPLSVYGASLRGPVGKGLVSAEFGWYDSRDDRTGDDPLVRNGELRFLVGYEQELAPDFTGGIQYYAEHMLDHDAYLRTLPTGLPAADETRHLVTLRLTLLTHDQNLSWSLFAYLSPSDRDYYLRPRVAYKVDDHFTIEAGANLMGGAKVYTFFGQLEDNSNVHFSIRYGF